MDGLQLIEENPLLRDIYQTLQHESLRRTLIQQTEKGFAKYGRTVDADSLTVDEWLGHLGEELTDAKVYAYALTRKELTGYEMAKVVMVIDILAHAQEILVKVEAIRNEQERVRRFDSNKI